MPARTARTAMDAATAMAVSGAAANPWTASGGVGVTRSLLVATLMALSNLRLGYWVPNPAHRPWRSFRPNHFWPGLAEVLGITLDEQRSVCLLSDGGHFENLGLYELVRRQVKVIVTCDGTADPDYTFADLLNANARIWADFGARIEFTDTQLHAFLPRIQAHFPRGALLSEKAFAAADILYADGSKGRLIYLNTALVQNLGLRLLGYKSANWTFPDQSTGDQFFDELQFEAYRELGFAVASSATADIRRAFAQAEAAADPVQ